VPLKAFIVFLASVCLPAQILAPITGGRLAAGSSTPSLVASVSGGTPRNNADLLVGAKVTIGGSNVVVTNIGRWCISGNSATHALKILAGSNAAELATVNVNMTGCTPGTFKYVALSYTMNASTAYYLASEETNGGDQWLDDDSTVTLTAAATLNSSEYGAVLSMTTHTAGKFYVPVSVQY